MKKLITIIIILMLVTITVFAELSKETKNIVEELRCKHYGICYGTIDSTVYYSGDDSIIKWKTVPIELVDIPVNVLMQLKGWEIWINDKCYYVLLIEKED